MNRRAIMGFVGLADGGRIKVTVNCRGSAQFMRCGRKTMQICCNRGLFVFGVKEKDNNKWFIAWAAERCVSALIAFLWEQQNEAAHFPKWVCWRKKYRSSCNCSWKCVRAWRWVWYGEGPPSPDNIDFHSTWGVLVELSIAKTKGRTSQSALKNTHTYQPLQFSVWPLLFLYYFFLRAQCSRSKRGSPFTLAFKWPFAPFPSTFGEERQLWLKCDAVYTSPAIVRQFRCCVFRGVSGRRSALQSEVGGVKKKKAWGWRWPPTRPDTSHVPSGISPMTISLLIVWLIMIKELVWCQPSTLHCTSNPACTQRANVKNCRGAGNERWRVQTLCLNSQRVNSHYGWSCVE